MEKEPSISVNGFTAHLVDEIIELGTSGLTLTTKDKKIVTIKIHLLQNTADSPAKRYTGLVLRVTSFNSVVLIIIHI